MRTSRAKSAVFHRECGSLDTLPWPPGRTLRASVLLAAFLQLLIAVATTPRVQAQSALEAALPGEPAAPLPLVYEQLDIEVRDQTVTFVLEQHFRNDHPVPVEGRYLLHTEEGAHVSGFSYWNGEQEIVGEVFEREEARAVYEQVTGLGRDPGLFEQLAEGTFSFRVFPIAPGETKRVRVRYSNWLPLHGDRALVRAPVHGATTRVRARLLDTRRIVALDSPTHTLAIDSQDATTCALTATPKRSDADHLEIAYRIAARPLQLHAAVHRDPGQDGYVRLSLATPGEQPAAQPAREVTLVIDRSGSMAGAPLEAARAAAARVVEQLTERDAINVIAFDDKAEALFRKPQKLEPATRKKALQHIAQIEPRGGTEIARAVSLALSSQNEGGALHQVLLLTDGQSDAQAAERAVRGGDPSARLFTVGLGDGVDKATLALLAEVRRGRFVFIPDSQAIEREVTRLLAQIARPLLTDLTLETEGATLSDVYPRRLRDLFVDDELCVHGRISADEASEAGVLVAHLHGKLDGEPFIASARIPVGPGSEHQAVGAGWARARTDDLLMLYASGDSNQAQVDEVIELALAYDFVTPFTSFLAIPASELTGETARSLSAMRAEKRRIKQLHADALALSRTAMPPGDPVLSVRAPRSARSVTARFPFGLTLSLGWDALTERWLTRFLVPHEVTDGPYRVEVQIEHADGMRERGWVEYVIDSQIVLTLDARNVPGGVLLRALSDEPLAEVRVLVDGRVISLRAASEGCFYAFAPLAPGVHKMRVVGRDRAGNEQTLEREVEVRDAEDTQSLPEEVVCR